MSQRFRFRGFRSPNYTQVPDELFDELLAQLSGAELKVLLYIVRRTFGFKKDSDNISLSQMLRGITTKDGRRLDRGVGLSKPTLLKALRDLSQKEVIVPTRRQSREHGDESTNYRLNIIGYTDQGASETLGGPAAPSSFHPVVKELDHGEVRTLTRAVGKEVSQGQGKKLASQYTVDKRQHVNVSDHPSEGNGRASRRPALSAGEIDYLAKTIAEATADHNPISIRTFGRIASTFGQSGVFELLGVVKEASRDRLIATNKGRYFVGVAKRVAKERGLDLNLRTRAA